MTARGFDPLRLDLTAFASEAATLDGRWSLWQLDRLAAAVVDDGQRSADEVVWRVRGERRSVRSGEGQVGLHLHAATELRLECQRCLKPVSTAVSIERSFLFVAGEDAAAQLDLDSEDDVLAISRAFDLRELIEDELLLALPLVPRHEVCPEPLPTARDDVIGEPEPSPFAALAALKRGGALN